MKPFSETRIALTMTGAEWTTIIARLHDKPLTPHGEAVYRKALKALDTQLFKASESIFIREERKQ